MSEQLIELKKGATGGKVEIYPESGTLSSISVPSYGTFTKTFNFSNRYKNIILGLRITEAIDTLQLRNSSNVTVGRVPYSGSLYGEYLIENLNSNSVTLNFYSASGASRTYTIQWRIVVAY